MTKHLTYSIIWVFVYLSIGLLTPAAAFNMSNANYILEMGNFNTFAGKKSNGNYTLTDTGGQIGPGLYSGPNFKVRAGFQYIYSLGQFAFSISPLTIDFGTVSNTFTTRNQTLTITNGSAYGYTINAAENHQLLVPATGTQIANTSCNSGTCTSSTAQLWDNTLAFGFGFRCDYYGAGSTCSSDFTTPNYFRPFADTSASQNPQIIASSTTREVKHQEQIIYKINVAGNQQAGDYSNEVRFVATPSF